MLGIRMHHPTNIVWRVWSPASVALNWWVRELAGLVPTSVRKRIEARNRPVVVRVASNEIYLDWMNNGPIVPTAEGDQHLPPAISARIRDRGCGLLLPASAALRRTLELPSAAEAEIVAAASFLVHQVTPFRVEQVHYSCTSLTCDRARKTVRFELTVVPAEKVSSWAARLRSNELSASAIRIEGDDRTLPLASPIGAAQGSARRSSWYREPWKLALTAAVVLLVVGPLAIAEQVHARAESLRHEVSDAENAGRQAAALRDEVNRLSNVENFLPRRLAGPPPLDVLAELATLLPDDAWLFDVSLASGEIRATGFSASMPTVLKSLQAARCFDAPELLGPVVHGSGRDRFEIKMNVVRPAP